MLSNAVIQLCCYIHLSKGMETSMWASAFLRSTLWILNMYFYLDSTTHTQNVPYDGMRISRNPNDGETFMRHQK